MSAWVIVGIIAGGIILMLEVVYPICWLLIATIREKKKEWGH